MVEASNIYIYKNDLRHADKRLKYLEEIEDPYTYELISKINLKKGIVCLELGAGRGSVAEHLCKIAGENGLVYAVDMDTRFLKRYSLKQLEIINKKIEEIELNENEYDFIHARHVLFHIKNYDKILGSLYRSLKPGGWILVEESDFLTWSAIKGTKNKDVGLFNSVIEKILDLYAVKGLDTACGTGCYKQLSDFKSRELISNSRCIIVRGRSDEAEFHRITLGQLKPSLLEKGYLNNNIINRFLNLFTDPNFCYRTRLTHSILMQKR